MKPQHVDMSIIIPTYQREQVLLETIAHVRALGGPPREIIIVDQTAHHLPDTAEQLAALHSAGSIRWLTLDRPSITHAMNVGLQAALGDVVLFLDDDVVPHQNLLRAHASAQAEGHTIVAGRVEQPWEHDLGPSDPRRSGFSGQERRWVSEVMGGNLSIARPLAIRLGGFDENFVQVAYRFEAEFADRVLAAGERMMFEPAASLRHLKVPAGGTRSFGDHLETARPAHTVGAYYYLMRAKLVQGRMLKILGRPLRSILTRHHLTRPWWIPITLMSELLGLAWAVSLYVRGPVLLNEEPPVGTK